MFRLSIAVILLLLTATPTFACLTEKTCSQMSNCAEAAYYLNICGHGKRDADNDGIPCESMCGDTHADYERRRAAEGFNPNGGAEKRVRQFSCSGKRTCGQMDDCDEARFYLRECGLGRLDRDGDGTPCESLCR